MKEVRRITVEAELDGSEELMNKVIAAVSALDCNVRFSIRQEIVPEMVSVQNAAPVKLMVPDLKREREVKRYGG